MKTDRLARLRGLMERKGLDAFLVSSLPNVRYLTGFSGSNALCVVRPHSAVFVTDPRYRLQSAAEVKGFRRCVTALGLYEGAAAAHLLRGCRRAGFESHVVTYALYRAVRKLFPRVAFHAMQDAVEELALVKDAGELDSIRLAIAIAERSFRELLPKIRPGVREIDLAAELTMIQRKNGADGDAFDLIVAAGEHGALPHAHPSTRRIRRGEFVTLDFGCTVRGYHSDITRTVAVGKATRRMRSLYEVVLGAQQAAIEAARPGMAARELDAVARRRIASAGLGRFFSHGLGHGFGLRIHERPRVSALSGEILREGSVITIEPGVYLPGECGIRIEDDILLVDGGCRVLTSAPRDFMIL
jgi:Xaa-Pro aminopeptidase